MTTNEQIKCPVCGEKAYEDDEGLMSCSNVNCNYIDDMYISDFKDFVTLIQSRIDKAVQAERERVINILELAGKKWDWTDGMRILIEEIITGATK